MKLKHHKVIKAQRTNDIEALTRMGHAGGLRAAYNRKLRRRAMWLLDIARAHLYSISPEGDILPPDYEALEGLV